MIAKNLKCIQELNICGSSIGDQGFVSLCSLPDLHKLQANCRLLTNTGFLDGAERLGNLKILEIGSSRIEIQAIVESLKYLPRLVNLKIKSIPVSVSDVKSIMEHKCPCLSILSLQCYQYSLQHLRQQTKQLCQQFGVLLVCFCTV